MLSSTIVTVLKRMTTNIAMEIADAAMEDSGSLSSVCIRRERVCSVFLAVADSCAFASESSDSSRRTIEGCLKALMRLLLTELSELPAALSPSASLLSGGSSCGGQAVRAEPPGAALASADDACECASAPPWPHSAAATAPPPLMSGASS